MGDRIDRELREHHAEGDRHLTAQAEHVSHLIDTHGQAAGCVCTTSGYDCVARRLYEDLRSLPVDSLADLLTGVILTRALGSHLDAVGGETRG